MSCTLLGKVLVPHHRPWIRVPNEDISVFKKLKIKKISEL